jgi:hypothetical protein
MSHEFVKQITSRERSESTDRVGGPKEREAVGYRFHGWFQILSGAGIERLGTDRRRPPEPGAAYRTCDLAEKAPVRLRD